MTDLRHMQYLKFWRPDADGCMMECDWTEFMMGKYPEELYVRAMDLAEVAAAREKIDGRVVTSAIQKVPPPGPMWVSEFLGCKVTIILNDRMPPNMIAVGPQLFALMGGEVKEIKTR